MIHETTYVSTIVQIIIDYLMGECSAKKDEQIQAPFYFERASKHVECVYSFQSHLLVPPFMDFSVMVTLTLAQELFKLRQHVQAIEVFRTALNLIARSLQQLHQFHINKFVLVLKYCLSKIYLDQGGIQEAESLLTRILKDLLELETNGKFKCNSICLLYTSPSPRDQA
eukprot:TRINITY_DN10164_c0_g1_i2.p2 TRINITY_DN10164_c0_g1~~TRINITY_DN10164_c0_g1_i2.p2  ORF type:complete len:169 (+),score=31.78 TRINITY_DN10164_c0_g1_i2:890-1396(+)